MTIFEPQRLATRVVYKERRAHLLTTNLVRKKRLNLVKNKSKLGNVSTWEVLKPKITITVIYISFKSLLTQKWPNVFILPQLVHPIIRHQTLGLICRALSCKEPQSSCTPCTSYRKLLASEDYYYLFSPLTGKNISRKIRHNKNFMRLKTLKKNILEVIKILLIFIKMA